MVDAPAPDPASGPLYSMLVSMNAKFDTLSDEVKLVNDTMNAKFDTVNAKFDTMNAKLDALSIENREMCAGLAAAERARRLRDFDRMRRPNWSGRSDKHTAGDMREALIQQYGTGPPGSEPDTFECQLCCSTWSLDFGGVNHFLPASAASSQLRAAGLDPDGTANVLLSCVACDHLVERGLGFLVPRPGFPNSYKWYLVSWVDNWKSYVQQMGRSGPSAKQIEDQLKSHHGSDSKPVMYHGLDTRPLVLDPVVVALHSLQVVEQALHQGDLDAGRHGRPYLEEFEALHFCDALPFAPDNFDPSASELERLAATKLASLQQLYVSKGTAKTRDAVNLSKKSPFFVPKPEAARLSYTEIVEQSALRKKLKEEKQSREMEERERRIQAGGALVSVSTLGLAGLGHSSSSGSRQPSHPSSRTPPYPLLGTPSPQTSPQTSPPSQKVSDFGGHTKLSDSTQYQPVLRSVGELATVQTGWMSASDMTAIKVGADVTNCRSAKDDVERKPSHKRRFSRWLAPLRWKGSIDK